MALVSVSCSVVSNPLRPHGLQPTRLLCSWDSPGKNTGAGSHSLLQVTGQGNKQKIGDKQRKENYTKIYNAAFMHLYKTAYEKNLLLCAKKPHVCTPPSFTPRDFLLTFIPHFLHSSSRVIQFRQEKQEDSKEEVIPYRSGPLNSPEHKLEVQSKTRSNSQKALYVLHPRKLL